MKTAYRPEIDGLRAFAVIAVILYHAKFSIGGISLVPGGFMGVDVFFVISGYLISALLFREIEVTGKFSLLHFYERRARRLLPVLFTVILSSLFFAWLLLAPSALIEFSKSIIYTLSFASNFYFHYSGLQYGAETGLSIPLLHTWSLSIEEQFYIFFPIAIVIAYKFFSRYLLAFIMLSLIASLLAADWGARHHPSATFYFAHARIWEMLAGVLLAYREFKTGHRSQNAILNKTLPALGLSLILYSYINFNENTLHPSLLTIVPVAGTCLVIWFSTQAGFCSRLLSSKPLLWTGLISYSLYLWHYPIFAFSRVINANPTEQDKIEWIALTFALSIFSYCLIEQPFRNRTWISREKFSKYALATAIAVISTSAAFIYQAEKTLATSASKINTDNKYLLSLRANNFGRGWGYFSKLNKKENTNVLILGDSHAFDLYQMVHSTHLTSKYNFGLCDIRLIYFSYNETLREYIDEAERGAIARTEKCLHGNALKKADTIILSDSFGGSEINYVEPLIDFLQNKGKKIILLSQSLSFKEEGGLTFLDHQYITLGKYLWTADIGALEHSFYKTIRAGDFSKNAQLKAIAAKRGIPFFDKTDYLCEQENERCDILTDKKEKIYLDHFHYTQEGAEYFGRKISKMNWLKIDDPSNN
ncbi:MAG: acyltransferase family protein [Pseudomonadota bacterium]